MNDLYGARAQVPVGGSWRMGTNLRPAAGHYFFDALREVLGSFLCAPRLNPHRTAKRYRTVTKVLVGTKPTFLFRGGLLFLFPGNGVQCSGRLGQDALDWNLQDTAYLRRSTLSGYGKRVKENLAQDFKCID